MVYLQYERIIRFHHEPGKGHYIIYFTLNERAVGCVLKKHDENLKIIKTCIDLSHFSGIDTGFCGRFADSAPTTLTIWGKLILLRENWAAS